MIKFIRTPDGSIVSYAVYLQHEIIWCEYMTAHTNLLQAKKIYIDSTIFYKQLLKEYEVSLERCMHPNKRLWG